MSEFLKFNDFRIVKLNFEVTDFDEENLELESDDIKYRFNIGYYEFEDESNLNILKVSCDVIKITRFNSTNIELILEGLFEVRGESEQEKEDFLKLNGTAILLPYVRNIVSTITGYDTTNNQILLPTINVQNLFKEEK